MGNRYGLHTSVEVDELHREPREVYQCYMRFFKPKSYSASGCNRTQFFWADQSSQQKGELRNPFSTTIVSRSFRKLMEKLLLR